MTITRRPLAAGHTVSIDATQARLTHDQVGSEAIGWLQFQPLFDQISRADLR
jgi:hypothetical protein